MTREVVFTPSFERLFRRLPKRIRDETYDKLALYLEDPAHPSLRVKRVRGTARIWEMSITMNYRLTFEAEGERVMLRRIGTHDVLRQPQARRAGLALPPTPAPATRSPTAAVPIPTFQAPDGLASSG